MLILGFEFRNPTSTVGTSGLVGIEGWSVDVGPFENILSLL
jgi:hypothetical protein